MEQKLNMLATIYFPERWTYGDCASWLRLRGYRGTLLTREYGFSKNFASVTYIGLPQGNKQ